MFGSFAVSWSDETGSPDSLPEPSGSDPSDPSERMKLCPANIK